jgi:hypothetical protein
MASGSTFAIGGVALASIARAIGRSCRLIRPP